MLQFFKKSGKQRKKSETVAAPLQSTQARSAEESRTVVLTDNGLPSQQSFIEVTRTVPGSSRSSSGPLASLDDEELFELDDQEVIKQHSRLSKTLDEVLNDKAALGYLEQFLQIHGGLRYVHCWIDVEQFKLELRRYTPFTTSSDEDANATHPVSGGSAHHLTSKEDHDSLSVSTDCDSFTADFSSLCDCSTASTLPEMNNKTPAVATSTTTITTGITTTNCDNSSSSTNKVVANGGSGGIKSSSDSVSNGCCCDKSFYDASQSEMSEKPLMQRDKVLEDLVEEALRIFKTYVSPEATENVKCSEQTRNEIVENICDTQRILRPNCLDVLGNHVREVLDKDYFQSFLGSDCFCKYQIDILTGRNVVLDDILYNETALFYFMEFLEQENETGLLEFWIAASNFQLQLNEQKGFFDPIEAQNDAVILYDKYFSLQAHCPLGFNNKIRFMVEQNICGENGITLDCFHLPLKIVEKVLRKNYLKPFLSSQLFYKYLSELINSVNSSPAYGFLEGNKYAQSDCSSEKSFCTNSTFLAMQIDSKGNYKNEHNRHSSGKKRTTDMNIDTRQLYDPDSLWKRYPGSNSCNKLAFGTVSSLGRYKRNFEPEPDKGAASRFKSAVKKLVNIEEDKSKEEMAWKVAEMIVKDITDITLGGDHNHRDLFEESS